MLTRMAYSAALVLLLAGAVMPQAPADQNHDVIVLKNGGVARGRILETVEGRYIVLEVSNGRTIKIDFEKIAFTTDNKNFDPNGVPAFKASRLNRTGEYHFITQAGVLSGNKSTNYSISVMAGPQLNEHLTLTAGLRFDRHSLNMLSGRFHLWVFGDLIPGNDGFNEFLLHFSVGYGQLLKDREETLRSGGSNMSLGVGGLLKLDGQRAVILELGWHHQTLIDRGEHVASGSFYTFSLGLRF